MIVFLTWVSSAYNNICSYELFTAMTTQIALSLYDKSLDIKIFAKMHLVLILAIMGE